MARELTPWTPPKPLEHIESSREDALRGNTFGILGSDAPVEEKLGRLVQLIQVALEIVDEARNTISSLREENAMLDRQLTEALAECKRLANENDRLRKELRH